LDRFWWFRRTEKICPYQK